MGRWRDVMRVMVFLAISVGWFPTGVGGTVEEDEVNCQPLHVHLTLGESADQMAVMWATNSTCDTQVTYSTSQWLTDGPQEHTAEGRVQQYTEHNEHGLHVLHKVMLQGLEPSKTYFYRPTSHKIGAGPFFFQTPPQGLDWSPNLLVVGDMGPHLELLPLLTEEALSGHYTAALQLGGSSPFLADANGTRGDRMMKGLEHVAAFIPVMTAPGQSETASGQYPGYRYRFSMPGSPWPMREEKLWYSFNLGPVHFISYCTDVYLREDQKRQTLQYQWLVKDLSQANTERQKRPWIIAFGYHPMYCTSDTQNDHSDCAKTNSAVRGGLEATLYYYGVDLILQSHPQASYERFYPLFKGVVLSNNYTNPRAPVHIVTGAASANTISDNPTTPVPVPKAKVPPTTPSPNAAAATPPASKSDSNSSGGVSGDGKGDGADKETTQTLTAFKFVNGTRLTYGRLQVINATHAHWQLLAERAKEDGSDKTKERTVLDSVWLVQEHHGKFQLSELPDDVEEKIDQNLVASGGEPGVLNVNDPEKDTQNMLAADDSRRLIIGVSFGAVVFLVIIIAIAVKLRTRVKRRTVRRWDVMDYKYGKTKLYTPTSNDDEEDDDFHDDHDFEMDIPDGSMQTKKLINGK